MLGTRHLLVFTLPLFLALAACQSESDPTPASSAPPLQVETVHVHFDDVPVVNELPGRLEPWRVAQVRARVGGIVEERLFTEGSEVTAGQPLFQIEPQEYQAAYDNAQAAVARAKATMQQTKAQLQRFSELVKTNALSQQAYDDAVFAHQQAEADLAAAQAAARSAKIDLDHTLVRAPLSGRIGRALVTEGALVGKGEVTHLATIQQLDPMYVNFMQSANDVLAIRQTMLHAASARQTSSEDIGPMAVRLVMHDGSEYPHSGELLFSDISVDPGSGQIMLRAVVPNPDQLLLPGLYVRARITQQQQRAALIPQQAAIRSEQGSTVLVVNEENRIEVRTVTISGALDHHWIVVDGLQEGEQIIVEGLQKAAPGTLVTAVPWSKELITSTASR